MRPGPASAQATEAVAQTEERAAEAEWSPWQALFNNSDPEEGFLEVAGLKERALVGNTGFEPVTSSMSTKRASPCANCPFINDFLAELIIKAN